MLFFYFLFYLLIYKKLVTLNAGTQTIEKVFSVEFVKNLENQLQEKKENFDRLRKEFSVNLSIKLIKILFLGF